MTSVIMPNFTTNQGVSNDSNENEAAGVAVAAAVATLATVEPPAAVPAAAAVAEVTEVAEMARSPTCTVTQFQGPLPNVALQKKEWIGIDRTPEAMLSAE